MKFKCLRKAQGALEYLLLIGGAVLIAVIVIALLVGMGGQSRDTAQNQSTQAQQSLEQPQPCSIVSLTGLWHDDDTAAHNDGLDTATSVINDCNSDANGWFKIDWQELGTGGVHTLKLYTNQNQEISSSDINVFNVRGTDAADDYRNLSSPQLTNTPAYVYVDALGAGCFDTHWVEVETRKNGQVVKSTRRKFYWNTS
jgi:hypothetical protein